jgi:hypothetical protein
MGGNYVFLLYVGMRLGSNSADCSMRARSRSLDTKFRDGRARNSAGRARAAENDQLTEDSALKTHMTPIQGRCELGPGAGVDRGSG